MDAITSIRCLEEKGLISSEVADRAVQYATVFVGRPEWSLYFAMKDTETSGSSSSESSSSSSSSSTSI